MWDVDNSSLDGAELTVIDQPTGEQIDAFDLELGATTNRVRFRVGDTETSVGIAEADSTQLLGMASWIDQPDGIKATIAALDGANAAQAARALMTWCQEKAEAVVACGTVELWTSNASPAEAAAFTAAGYGPARSLYQLRVELPVAPLDGPPLEWRPFVVDQDEDGFLKVNGRAFIWHPEQGDMSRADLDAAKAEAWFDPDGFVIHPITGPIDGFCWTKVHPATTSPVVNPVLGEIYVIAVDPDAGGQGLGRKLVHAGLDHLVAQGITTGMLYVEADNEPALGLYRSMGFVEHLIDQRWSAR